MSGGNILYMCFLCCDFGLGLMLGLKSNKKYMFLYRIYISLYGIYEPNSNLMCD